MAAAIDFDHQLFLNTAKIGYVFPNRELAPEFQALQLPVAQAAPENRFRRRLVLAQPARLLRSRWSRLVQGHLCSLRIICYFSFNLAAVETVYHPNPDLTNIKKGGGIAPPVQVPFWLLDLLSGFSVVVFAVIFRFSLGMVDNTVAVIRRGIERVKFQ